MTSPGIVKPMVVDSLSNIPLLGISIAKDHCIAWDSNGVIYSWGCALDGKLGHPIE